MPTDKPEMKCYRAEFLGEDWCTLIHGKNRGQAKANFMEWNPLGNDRSMFVDIRLTRLPGLDDKPINYENALAANFEYEYDLAELDGPISIYPKQLFTNDCRCEICQKGY